MAEDDLLALIREKFANTLYEYLLHAVDQSILRSITRTEVEHAIGSGELIEDYPTDKYGPSCLISGFTEIGRAIHVQCTHPIHEKIKIITVYEPDPQKWSGEKRRRHEL